MIIDYIDGQWGLFDNQLDHMFLVMDEDEDPRDFLDRCSNKYGYKYSVITSDIFDVLVGLSPMSI